MQKEEIIQKTADHVKELFLGESTGHDWWHIYRVWQMSLRIGQKEGGDLFVIQLGALLHDIADFKFHNGDLTVGLRVARVWLEEQKVNEVIINQVCYIVKNVSFKGANVANTMKGLEGKVVQDADRIDALGAIGIARTFAYNSKTGNPLYDPELKPHLHDSFEEYKNARSTAINHFYEKILLIKDKLNTPTARKIAEHRHTFLEQYLEEFFKEWEAER